MDWLSCSIGGWVGSVAPSMCLPLSDLCLPPPPRSNLRPNVARPNVALMQHEEPTWPHTQQCGLCDSVCYQFCFEHVDGHIMGVCPPCHLVRRLERELLEFPRSAATQVAVTMALDAIFDLIAEDRSRWSTALTPPGRSVRDD